MNGNRGAKGSITDRLISMMYRNRYRQFKLKKESYTVDKKKEEKVYLETLQSYQEDKNPFVLTKKDRTMFFDRKESMKKDIEPNDIYSNYSINSNTNYNSNDIGIDNNSYDNDHKEDKFVLVKVNKIEEGSKIISSPSVPKKIGISNLESEKTIKVVDKIDINFVENTKTTDENNADLSSLQDNHSDNKIQVNDDLYISPRRKVGIGPVEEEKNEYLDKAVNDLIVDEDALKKLSDIDIDVKFLNELTDEDVDLKKEVKQVESEIVILTELDEFIKDSKPVLDEIKSELEEIEELNKDTITLTKEDEIKKRYDDVSKKLSELKNKYQIIKEKYNFEDYGLLDNIKLLEATITYKDLAKIDEVEVMVDVCKDKVEELKQIEVIDVQSKKVSKGISDNENQIKERDKNYKITESKYLKAKDIDIILKKELEQQNEILQNLNSRVDRIEKIISKENKIFGYDKLLSSMLKVAVGVFTLPFDSKKIGKTALGVAMINRGLNGMKKSLYQETEIKVTYKYEDLEREIYESKDKLGDLDLLLTDSIDKIRKIKEYFKDNFDQYKVSIDEYSSFESKINYLEKTLLDKQKQLNNSYKKVDNLYERNKIKILRAKQNNNM